MLKLHNIYTVKITLYVWQCAIIDINENSFRCYIHCMNEQRNECRLKGNFMQQWAMKYMYGGILRIGLL